tara:strand:- start:829 stop:1146 length:318 start_codon:yes stop_codon:yes gene_type:complete
MSMDNEKSRAEFEAWARRRGVALWLHPNGSGKYYCGAAQQAFEAWIESRAALVVELPPLNNSHLAGPDSEYGPSIEQVEDMGFDYGIKACREILNAAGITVKEQA